MEVIANLTFQFSSMADLWWMEGHGPYVWASYAITLCGIVYLAYSPYAKKKKFFANQQRVQARIHVSENEGLES